MSDPLVEQAEALIERCKRDELMTVRELEIVLAFLRLPHHRNTVRRWIREGKIAVQRSRVSNRLRIRGSEVLNVAEWQQKVSAA